MGVDVNVFYSWGATEAKVVEGLADGIVEVTETGTTIRAHGLRIIDEVMCSYPVIIANEEAWADPRKRAKIDQLTLLLQGALRAESLVAIKMNAPASNLDAILEMLPSLNSPTVSPPRMRMAAISSSEQRVGSNPVVSVSSTMTSSSTRPNCRSRARSGS